MSGAFASVLEGASDLAPGLGAANMSELQALAKAAAADAARAPEDERANIAREIEELERHLDKTRATVDIELATLGGQLQERVRKFDQQLAATRESMVGVLRWVSGALRALILSGRKQWAIQAARRRRLFLSRLVGDITRRLETSRSGAEMELARRVALKVDLSARWAQLVNSPDARGADGELLVIEQLSHLPDDCIVLNDLQLRVRSFLRFDGEPVQSAQVDHLVVAPTGIFLIETKAWSESFARSGVGFDPFKQVSRAGLLCHVILKEAGMPCRVKNVIARTGRIPDSPHMKYVSLRHPRQLADLVRGGRDSLRGDEVVRVSDHLWGTYGSR